MGGLIVDIDVDVPMCDGVALKADVWRPVGASPRSAVIFRTPYDKSAIANIEAIRPETLAHAGFAAVVQDTRGRFRSGGAWSPIAWEQEGRDGFDTVEWTARQDWCSGRVGMAGQSYLGIAQLFAAALQPPSLAAIAPHMASAWPFDAQETGGALRLDHLYSWLAFMAPDWLSKRAAEGTPASPELAALLTSVVLNPRAAMDHRPLRETPAFNAPGFPLAPATIFDRSFGQEVRALDLTRIRVPSLHSGGWFDCFQRSTVGLFQNAREIGAPSHLLMGPWVHIAHLSQLVADMNYGLFASGRAADVSGAHVRFFQRYLDGANADLPAIRYFLMGANKWEVASDWPPFDDLEQTYYLGSDGNAARKSGVLSTTRPLQGGTTASYQYDPSNPTPSIGGRVLYLGGLVPGPVDAAQFEERSDVLVFTSEPAVAPYDIVGEPIAALWILCSAIDLDIVVRLSVVDENACSRVFAYGALRGRFRNDPSAPDKTDFLEAEKPALYRISLGHTAQRIAKGQALRVSICSGDYPHLDPNLGTDAEPGAGMPGPIVDVQLLHSDQFPSSVSMPVRPCA